VADPDQLRQVLDIAEAQQFKALSHPVRHRLLFELRDRAATISQLAAQLDLRKGTVGHHLKVLHEAGMVRVVETRQVRGGTEQYYRRTAERFRYVGEESGEIHAAMLRTITGEIATAKSTPVLTLRQVRLTKEQAEELARTLEELAENVEQGDESQPRYGLLLGLYQPE
jgi:DNA-binding transcriptional ArsR family regulator